MADSDNNQDVANSASRTDEASQGASGICCANIVVKQSSIFSIVWLVDLERSAEFVWELNHTRIKGTGRDTESLQSVFGKCETCVCIFRATKNEVNLMIYSLML